VYRLCFGYGATALIHHFFFTLADDVDDEGVQVTCVDQDEESTSNSNNAAGEAAVVYENKTESQDEKGKANTLKRNQNDINNQSSDDTSKNKRTREGPALPLPQMPMMNPGVMMNPTMMMPMIFNPAMMMLMPPPPAFIPGIMMPMQSPYVITQQPQAMMQQQYRGMQPFMMFPPQQRPTGIALSLPCDAEELSEYQWLVRQQLELFEGERVDSSVGRCRILSNTNRDVRRNETS
jgi:hypothetical protein